MKGCIGRRLLEECAGVHYSSMAENMMSRDKVIFGVKNNRGVLDMCHPTYAISKFCFQYFVLPGQMKRMIKDPFNKQNGFRSRRKVFYLHYEFDSRKLVRNLKKSKIQYEKDDLERIAGNRERIGGIYTNFLDEDLFAGNPETIRGTIDFLKERFESILDFAKSIYGARIASNRFSTIEEIHFFDCAGKPRHSVLYKE